MITVGWRLGRRPRERAARGAAVADMRRSVDRREASSFDALRLLAAFGVLFGHHFLVAGRAQPSLGEYGDLAPICVFFFFAISGYFIAGSWNRDPHLVRYWSRRVLRIYPALIATVLVTVFLIGSLTTTLTVGEYFSDTETWSYLKNAVLVFGVQYGLPGVFADSPTVFVNLSLWSLPIEIAMYSVLSVVAFFASDRTRIAYPILAVVSGMLWYVSPSPDGYAVTQMFGLGATFFIGASVYEYSLLPRFSGGVVGFAVVLLASGAFLPREVGQPVLWLTLPVVALGLGAHKTGIGAAVARFGDISYGVYLWAFPIQQLAVRAFGFIPSLIVAAVFTTLAGWLSMRAIEVPALRFRPQSKREAAVT